MSHKAAKIGLTGLVLALAFGGLLYTTIGESAQYYKHVDEVMVQPEPWYGKPLQIHGYAKNVSRTRDTLKWRFDMESNGHVVRAYYTGVTTRKWC
jgi:cytochrome c-type biogenesis protein CcmE